MEIIKLSESYKKQLKNLVEITVQNLEKPEWLIALSENEIEKYEMLIEKCNNEEFKDILKKRLDNAKN